MNAIERIEHAGPDGLVGLLYSAVRWLHEEWFDPWLDDPRVAMDEVGCDVDGGPLHHLGTLYLGECLDDLAEMVDDVAHGLASPVSDAQDAAAQWAAIHRRGLALVVDLYELAAARNADLRRMLEQEGCEVAPPGLLLSETTEDAITILYEGLQRAAGLLETAARTRRVCLPPAGELLEREFADALSDGDRFMDAYRRGWGISRCDSRCR